MFEKAIDQIKKNISESQNHPTIEIPLSSFVLIIWSTLMLFGYMYSDTLYKIVAIVVLLCLVGWQNQKS